MFVPKICFYFLEESHQILLMYINIFSDTRVSKQVVLDLPDEVVEGSARAFFTVVGKLIKYCFMI
jgi:hypothetical protein